MERLIIRGTIIHVGGPLVLLSFLFILIALRFIAPQAYITIVETIKEIARALLGR